MAQDTEFFEFKNNLPEINKGIKELTTSLNKLNGSLGASSRSNDKYTQSNNRVENSISDTDEKVEKLNKSNEKQSNILGNLTSKLGKLSGAYRSAFSAISPINLGTIGLSFSMSGLISTAFGEIKALSALGDSLTYLSSDTGSVTGAMNLLHAAAGQSTLAVGTMQGVLKSLSDQGIETKKDFMDLSKLAGAMQSATGAAASAYGSFTGELSYKYGVPIQGIKNITSSLIATGLTGTTLEKVIGSVNKVLSNTAFIAGKTTPKALENTTKAINSSIYAFNKLGISAEKATGFIEGITDPDKFEENAYLFGKLGISVGDYSDMLMDAENGQKRLLGKVMTNLPALSKQIKSIQSNPFAMRQLAKSLNLDMEMVQKMASSSEEDMQRLMQTYEQKAEEDKALKKKEEEQKKEAAKFEDALTALKRKALQPLMNFVSNNLGNIMSLFSKVSEVFAVVLKAIVPVLKTFSDVFVSFSKSGLDFIKKFEPEMKQFSQMIVSLSTTVFDFIKDFGPSFLKGFIKGVKDVGDIIKDLYTYIEPVVSSIISFASSILPSKKTGQDAAEGSGELLAKGGAGLAVLYGGFKLLKGVAGLVSSRQKTVSNAKVGELADAIGQSVSKYNNSSPTQMGFLRGPLMKGALTLAAATVAYNVVSSVIKDTGGSKRSEVMGGGAAAYYAGKSTMSGETLQAISDASKAKGFRGRIDAFKESKSLSKTLTELERVGVKNLDLSKTWKFTSKETKDLFTKTYGEGAEKTFETMTKQLKGSGLSGKVIPKAPTSGASLVKNELKDVFKSSLGIGKEGRRADNVTRELRSKGFKEIFKDTSYATQEASGLAKVSSNLKDTLSPLKQVSNLKTVSSNIGNFTKSFAKGGALPTILADMAGGYLGGKGGSKLNEMMGGTEEQGKMREKAGKNLGSYGASTAAAAMYGGPVAAAINAAMIGAFRGMEDSEELKKSMWRPFAVAAEDENMLDKAADKLQAGLGGALTLGLGFVLDDTIELITGKESTIGKQMTGLVSNAFTPLTMSIRTMARVYDKVSEGFDTASKKYSSAALLLNKEMDKAGKQMNDAIKKGDYFGALKSLGPMISNTFERYIWIPIKTFFMGLKDGAVNILAGMEKAFNEKLGIDKDNIFYMSLFTNIQKESKRIAAFNEEVTQYGMKGNLGELYRLRNYANKETDNSFDTTTLNKLITLLENEVADAKIAKAQEAANRKKEREENREDMRSGFGAAMKDNKDDKPPDTDKAPPARDQYDSIIQTLLKTGYILPLKS